MKKLLLIASSCLLLAGCNDENKVFGVEIGGSEKQLRNKVTIESEDLIPSKVHFLELALKAAPENDVGDEATYVASSVDGVIVGVRAKRDDEKGIYYSGMLAYAKNKLGNPIASDQGIINEEKVNEIPIGCAKNGSCPTPQYTAYRKGSLNALVSSGNGQTDIMFYDDDLQKAFK
ncbi:hypothetical protein [Erwinia sp. S38]|uniref:hypothetical protein n=1 Tax=Erwinia sp. S38 TaxID=2769338 RepID=UPI00190D2433|nr:hypothetical protein [Erwinia sp. S38]MBK0001440.1 hypothetical protein [Erwinia sp. S38]